MRLLTHLLSVAFLCLCSRLAAQPLLFPGIPISRLGDSSAIFLEDPLPAGKGRLLLQWSLREPNGQGYVKLERSAYKEGPFEVVSVVREDSLSATGVFTDELPLRGINHYRVKYVDAAGKERLSRVVTTGLEGERRCRFYPNPVDNMLIIRSEQALDLQISDGSGKARLLHKIRPGLQTIDVSHLEKGLYIITLTQTDTGRSLTEKLMKN